MKNIMCLDSRICFKCVFSRCCRNISATVLEIGDPIESLSRVGRCCFGRRNSSVGEGFLVA